MPYRVEISAQATRDLDRIYQFIEAESSQAAARWFNGLYDALHSLSDMPKRAPLIPERPGLRHLLYGNKPHIYRAIYSIDETSQRVTIHTIRYGAQAPLELGVIQG